MGWGDAIAAVGSVIKKTLDYWWGEQTRAERTLEHEAEHAAAMKREALNKVREAHNANDPAAAARHMGDANRWHAELLRLRDEAAAKRPP